MKISRDRVHNYQMLQDKRTKLNELKTTSGKIGGFIILSSLLKFSRLYFAIPCYLFFFQSFTLTVAVFIFRLIDNRFIDLLLFVFFYQCFSF